MSLDGIAITLYLLFAHDLFGKPVSTFPDHALGMAANSGRQPNLLLNRS
jgi:hypothetical protein